MLSVYFVGVKLLKKTRLNLCIIMWKKMRIILTISVKLWQILNTDVWFIIITIRISLKVGIEKSIVLAALKIGQIYRLDPHRVQLRSTRNVKRLDKNLTVYLNFIFSDAFIFFPIGLFLSDVSLNLVKKLHFVRKNLIF